MTSEAAGSIRIATATAMKSRSRSGTEYFRSTGNTPVFAVSGVFVGSGIIVYYCRLGAINVLVTDIRIQRTGEIEEFPVLPIRQA
jgi:hypothetical protein